MEAHEQSREIAPAWGKDARYARPSSSWPCWWCPGVAGAEQLSPWFRLSSVSRPSYLAPASEQGDESYLLQGTGEGLMRLNEPVVSAYDSEQKLPLVAGEADVHVSETASALEMQQALEGMFGVGNVEVSGGAGGIRGDVRGCGFGSCGVVDGEPGKRDGHRADRRLVQGLPGCRYRDECR